MTNEVNPPKLVERKNSNALVTRDEITLAEEMRAWRGLLSSAELDTGFFPASQEIQERYPEGQPVPVSERDEELRRLAAKERSTASISAVRVVEQVAGELLRSNEPEVLIERHALRLAPLVDRGEVPLNYVQITIADAIVRSDERLRSNRQFWESERPPLDLLDQAEAVGELIAAEGQSHRSPGTIFERDNFEGMASFLLHRFAADIRHRRGSFYVEGQKISNEVMQSRIHAGLRLLEVRGPQRDETIHVTDRDVREVTNAMRRMCQVGDDWTPPQETIAIEESIMAQFIRECCVLESGAYVRTVDFRTAFNDYLNARGLPLMTPKQVGNLLSRETGGGITSKPAPRSFDPRQPRCYAGLRLR